MSRLAVLVISLPIHLYRWIVSPVLPRTCRFHPSCSTYALASLGEHGPWRGLILAARRLSRCHPFHPGGIDEVPLRTLATPASDPSAARRP